MLQRSGSRLLLLMVLVLVVVVVRLGLLLSRWCEQTATAAHTGGQRGGDEGRIIERIGGRIGRTEGCARVEVGSERSEGCKEVTGGELVLLAALSKSAERRQLVSGGAREGGGSGRRHRGARLIQCYVVPIAGRERSQR